MKVSYVFFADGFEEVEALTCVDVMRRAGMPVVTVSINPVLEVTGAHGVTVVTDSLFEDNDYSDAEWLVLPGGVPGAPNLVACEPLCDALLAQNKRGGKVAAICASPSLVLAPLGILSHRQAVCYPGMENPEGEVNWGDTRVSVDGNVVTGNGPASAAPFALTIVAESLGREKAAEVASGMLQDF